MRTKKIVDVSQESFISKSMKELHIFILQMTQKEMDVINKDNRSDMNF